MTIYASNIFSTATISEKYCFILCIVELMRSLNKEFPQKVPIRYVRKSWYFYLFWIIIFLNILFYIIRTCSIEMNSILLFKFYVEFKYELYSRLLLQRTTLLNVCFLINFLSSHYAVHLISILGTNNENKIYERYFS